MSPSLSGNKNISIVWLRVTATIFIFLCHTLRYYNNPILSASTYFFNNGVYIFLVISGFLYSKKSVSTRGTFTHFIKGRYIRVTLPVLITAVIVGAINAILTRGGYPLVQLISHALNLEIFLPQMTGIHHLWFVSVIFICYLVMYLIDYLQVQQKLQKKIIEGVLLVVIHGFLLFFIITNNFNFITYVVCGLTYFVGYFLPWEEKYGAKSLSIKSMIALTFTILISMAVRLLCRSFFDETWFYYVMVGYSQTIIAGCIFVLFLKLNKTFQILSKNKYVKNIISYLDGISYEFYIVHYIFVCGEISLINITNNTTVNILLIFVISFIFASLLHCVCGALNRVLVKNR